MSTPETQTKRTKLGRYSVGAKIAGGGMASVFLGRVKEDGGERVVALKVIKDEHAADESYVKMFMDEAKILSHLEHPNVIDTLEFGIEGEERFIAMELLLGRSLSDVWDATVTAGDTFPLDVGMWTVARTAEGLHYAHDLRDESGDHLHVIHRDVNPTNIFLTYDGQVKLIDFGLAKAARRVSKTLTGVVKGKIPYLAPEQIRGIDIDRRADIYTLGITLWEVTSGRRLFKRETDAATFRAISQAVVPDPREFMPDYPPALWKVVSKMLATERDDRYSTAAEVAAALDKVLGKKNPQEMKDKISSLLDRAFPGERSLQASWLEGARHASGATKPPAPVPSSIALDEGPKSTSSEPSQKIAVAAPAEVPAEPESEPEVEPEPDEAVTVAPARGKQRKKEASQKKKRPRKKITTAMRPPAPSASDLEEPEPSRVSRTAPASPPATLPKQLQNQPLLWIAVGIGVAVLVYLLFLRK